MTTNRRFVLKRRPHGAPVAEDFALLESPIPTPSTGEFVVRNRYVSLDPAQRGWMDDVSSYMPPIPLGAPIRATTVGQVHASANPGFTPGDWVLGLNGIEEYSLVAAGGFTQRIDVSKCPSPSYFLSAMGAVGLTAYFALLDVGKPQRGEIVLVSGAAGAVGSAVGQIAKIKGCRTIGIVGGPEKCLRLTRDYGFDVAIDYRDKDLAALMAEIHAAAPTGVDIVFENVGGMLLDAALMNLAMRARIILCGLIAEYNSEEKLGARNLWQVIVKRATMHGFLIMDYLERFTEGGAEMARWISEGRMRIDEDIVVGIENAYPAFMRLFSGANRGKLILGLT